MILDVLIGQLLCTHIHVPVNIYSDNSLGYKHSISLHPPPLHIKEYLMIMLHILQLMSGLFSNNLSIACISIAAIIHGGILIKLGNYGLWLLMTIK